MAVLRRLMFHSVFFPPAGSTGACVWNTLEGRSVCAGSGFFFRMCNKDDEVYFCSSDEIMPSLQAAVFKNSWFKAITERE